MSAPWAATMVTLAVLLWTHESSAADDVSLPPWGDAALPAWAQSVQVRDPEQPVRLAPDPTAPRRGSASREVLLPLFGARIGPGCHRPWLHIGPQAWICQDDVTLSGSPPMAANRTVVGSGPDGLPFRYYFVATDGSLAYERIEDTDVGEPTMSLEPGFAVAIVEERRLGREIYGRTNRGLWVPMRELGAARSFAFHGADITTVVDGVIPLAWVVVDHARLYSRRGQMFVANGKRNGRFEQVGFHEHVDGFAGSYARIDDDNWIRTRDIRHPTLAPPPPEPGILLGERWIDIELSSQTLLAYEGTRPVFATIVSTGKGKRKGHPFETPKGVHRVWVKLLSSVMDNLENEEASRYYRIEDVPYVQYFSKGVGLHAAFWHRSFGHVRSHGCVNLAPLDAKRLFSWTGPRMPAGWIAVLPTRYDRGTIVRVR
ncbi:MAG: L,D-transpeptidase [Deltaproteobacteria bacterium]|nr:L,D-transpeptidase [Deltaproteobacteria bacterium]